MSLLLALVKMTPTTNKTNNFRNFLFGLFVVLCIIYAPFTVQLWPPSLHETIKLESSTLQERRKTIDSLLWQRSNLERDEAAKVGDVLRDFCSFLPSIRRSRDCTSLFLSCLLFECCIPAAWCRPLVQVFLLFLSFENVAWLPSIMYPGFWRHEWRWWRRSGNVCFRTTDH